MKIKRFVAADMRTALRMIRDELGADAVMLSSQSVAAGIEVMAATGYDETALAHALQTEAQARPAGTTVSAQAAAPSPSQSSSVAPSPVSATAAAEASAAPRDTSLGPASFDDPAAAFAAALARPRMPVDSAPAAAASLRERARARLVASPGPTLAELSAAIRPEAVRDAARHLPLQRAPTLAANADRAATPRQVETMASIDDGISGTAVSFGAMPQATATAKQAAWPEIAAGIDIHDIPADTIEARNPDTTVQTPTPPVLSLVAAPEADHPVIVAMREDMAQMRRLMEAQVQHLERERLRGSPARAAAFDALLGYGCDDALAQAVAAQLDPALPVDAIQIPLLGALTRTLRVGAAEPIDEGGVIALVGPTGAGKTTTVAKLAARFAARHRARDVALVTTDCERPGAHEQLQAHGRKLGVTVCEARGATGVQQALAQLTDYPLVLVDTTGYAPTDRALFNQILWLRNERHVRSLLVLPANGHPQDMRDVIRRYQPCAPEGLVLTKLDETGHLGAAVSVATHSGLPIAYTAHGQRADADLEAGHALRIAKAMGVARRPACHASATRDEVLHAVG